jgi:hypothetical protein
MWAGLGARWTRHLKFHLSAPDLSRVVGLGFTQRLVPRNPRSNHVESKMVATPHGSKPARMAQVTKPYASRAEFFALPAMKV